MVKSYGEKIIIFTTNQLIDAWCLALNETSKRIKFVLALLHIRYLDCTYFFLYAVSDIDP